MRRTLARLGRRNRRKGQDLGVWVFALAGLALLLFLLNRKSQLPVAGTYRNSEEWEVSYNSEGLPTKISVHRDAKRQ